MGREAAESVEVRRVEELEAWLAANHARPDGIWLILWRKGTEHHVSYEAAVCAALCWGWIDAQARRVDDTRRSFWLSPRRPGSIWSRLNKDRVARLAEEGRLQPRALAGIAAAKADGSWAFLDDIDAMIVPDDLARALGAVPGAREGYEGFSSSAKKGLLYWIKSAKREATRTKRIRATVEGAADGRVANA